MKNKPFISFMALLLLVSISFISCDNDGGGGSSQDTQALTENDFANDPSLRADPEKHLIVKFLEYPDSEDTENDTGGVGNDVIPLTYTRTLEHTYCWEDDDGGAGHFMELDDSEGNEILRIDVNGECVTKVIEAGNYVMTIHHDGRMETTHPVFIIPNRENNQQARETDGLINRFKVAISKSLENIQNKFIGHAIVLSSTPFETLITTRSCVGCDLKRADLSFKDLEGADLTRADLTRADLSNSNFAGAKFTSADLNRTDMSRSSFVFADFTLATLTRAIFTGADFSSAIWTDGECRCQVNCYVANNGEPTITVIDTFTNMVGETIDIGSGPRGLAVSPDGSTVYLTAGVTTVLVIDTSTNMVGETIDVGQDPQGVAVSPDGSTVYAAIRGNFTVSVIDTATNTVVATIPVGSFPQGLAVSPDGFTVWLTNLIINTVSRIDTGTNMVLEPVIFVGSDPFELAVSPDGSTVYVANGSTVSVIDTHIISNIVGETIDAGVESQGVAVSPDSSTVYVTDGFENTVSVIDTATNKVVDTIDVGQDPHGVAVSPDGSTLYVANSGDNTVSVIDTATNMVGNTIDVGSGPQGLAVSPGSIGQCVGCQ